MRMPQLYLLLLSLHLAAPYVSADEPLRFTLSLEQARDLAKQPGERILIELGDAKGPFLHTGTLHLEPGRKSASTRLAVMVEGKPKEWTPEVYALKSALRAESFLNAEGNGFVVVHWEPTWGDLTLDTSLEREDTRSERQIFLSDAAKLALWEDDSALLLDLIKHGLVVDQPISNFSGSLLHEAVITESAAMTKLILEQGANKDLRDEWGKRPIDYAIQKNLPKICELLKKPDEKEAQVGGFPLSFLTELLVDSENTDPAIIFLSFNGAPPVEDLMKFFLQRWPNARPSTAFETLDSATTKRLATPTSYRDREKKDFGLLVEINVTPNGNDTYEWSHRVTSGPIMAGGGVKGKISRKYGYWIRHDESGWDE